MAETCDRPSSEWGFLWGEARWGDGVPGSVRYLQQLLPRGLAWTRHRCANLTFLLEGLGVEFDEVLYRGTQLLRETDPRTADETIDEWEDMLDLPDPCDIAPPTDLAGRRAAAHAKLIARGRQDPLFYIEVAAALGYTVTISRYTPFTCTSNCNDSLYVGQWQHAVLVSGSSGLYDDILECRLDQMKQTHGSVVLELA